jgi:hypothetical protein
MEYKAILNQVEEQKKEKIISGKMFRYSGLILAVDFFSQKLNSDQILEAAFDFINELLTLETSYEFSFSDNSYKLGRVKGVNKDLKVIDSNEALKNLAVLHGRILIGQDVILKYFSKELLHTYNPEIIIPVIVDSDLEGFILIPQRTTGKFDDDDFIICEVLMKLFNSSMENYKRYNELHSINISLDEKIFNLFAINQSSKALLSELDLDSLYRLSIDVFSELTTSSTTGFILYDEKIERYALKSYRLIYDNNKTIALELDLRKSAVIEPNRIIIDMSKEQDRNYFKNLFTNGIEALNELAPQYLVLLNRDSEILGFVTLGSSVTGAGYKPSVFELIESLASSTYISISNAKHFKQVKEQKVLLQNKLDRLISLNNLTKNINSSGNINTLLEITLRTLRISFSAEKCLIALYDKDKKRFCIENSYGINGSKKFIETNKYWNRLFKGRTALAFDTLELKNYFGRDVAKSYKGISAALIVPIYIDKTEIELLGIIAVFEFFNSIISEEENVLTMETIAGHIAPILYNLRIIEEQNTLLIPNYPTVFKNDLKKEISQAKEYNLDLCVIKLSIADEFSFSYPDMAGSLKPHFPKVYPFSFNTVYVITNEKVNDNDIAGKIREITGIQGLSVKTGKYGQDFNTYDEFMA